MNGTNDKGRTQPMTPGLRNLLGGGAPGLLKGEVPLKGVERRSTGPVQTLPRLGSPVAAPPMAVGSVPLLGQGQLPQAPSAMIGPPSPSNVQPGSAMIPSAGQQSAPPAPVQYRKCPGPIELPDGRVIEPDDYLRLNDICEIMPYLIEALGAAGKGGLAPGQSVPLVGGRQSGAQPVPGHPSFGPAGGPFGGGGTGGAMFGGGGGGGPGPQGAVGPQGTPGLGGKTESSVKTDGTFSAGPGMFVPVPGTEVKFTTSQDGAVLFMLQAVLGAPPASGPPQNTYLGIRVDGVDHPLTPRLLHTMAAGVGEFTIGQAVFFPQDLTAGDHTAEVILRGIKAGEFGGGLGSSGNVMAEPGVPLILTAVFS